MDNNNQLIVMTAKEAKRYDTIKDLIDKKIDTGQTAQILGLSIRQVKRIKAKVLKLRTIQAVIHGNRGKISNRCIKEETVEKAKKLLKEKYPGFNPLLAQEHLRDDDKIKASKETVRKWMIDEKLWKPKKKSDPKKHLWRERKDSFGEMQQFDGSYHNWFEGRSTEEEQCLLLSVDDATGKITGARFEYNEGVKPVFAFWQQYFKEKGLPRTVYLDKFSTYKVNHKHAVDNQELMTQFERAMRQLDVGIIHANTPQAKGRVERMNKTLQNRLVKEMRLKSICTIPEANKFLKEEFIPKFNKQFAVIPKKNTDLHRKLTGEQDNNLSKILSIQSERTVSNDYTVRFKNNYFQLQEVQPTTVYKKDKIIVEEHLDGTIKLVLRDKYLHYFSLPQRPQKEIEVNLPAITSKKPSGWIPPQNHPWRRQFMANKKQPDPAGGK